MRGVNENLGFRPQLTAAATLLHLLADSLQCGTEEKCVLELRRISIALQDKKSLAALPDAQARPALARRGARVRRLACSRSCRWRSLRAFLARPRAAAALAPLFALPLIRGLCKTWIYSSRSTGQRSEWQLLDCSDHAPQDAKSNASDTRSARCRRPKDASSSSSCPYR